MMFAYKKGPKGLDRLAEPADLPQALWIDLYRPTDEQVARVQALGVEVPTLADMEEIEISNRLYREDGTDVMTVVLTGRAPDGQPASGPVTFILTPERLVTVRHHVPRPFETLPERADRSSAGCGSADRVFLALMEECVSRAADLLEGAGRALDVASSAVFDTAAVGSSDILRKALVAVGQQGEMVGRVRLALLTLDRAVSFYTQVTPERIGGKALAQLAKAELRDIQALAVHADFLAGRVSFVTDAAMGMINLDQNTTVRILSVVTALFLPPTLIASIYGMNFQVMPELTAKWGYPYALILMAASSAATWAFFKWKKWL